MSDDANPSASKDGPITYRNRWAFWIGVAAVTAGVLGHLPMYLMGSGNGYRLDGMAMDTPMLLGMLAIVVGFGLSLYGLWPVRPTALGSGPTTAPEIAALDDAPLNRHHVALLVAMAIAVTIDIMKPTALAFVMPGMSLEYGLRSPLNPGGTIPVAFVALSGISGTVLGSFLWGWLGDRIGRRASILYAGIAFIGTSICGAMPSFGWNLAMCFLMGLAVGGMLPICYALMAETIPARHRGWLMIMIGADIAGAYILTSWLAAALVPEYSWRILWLIGLPTGVLFILLNRWIPESPRFLLVHGRNREALEVMKRYGAVIRERKAAPALLPSQAGWSLMLSPANRSLTWVVGCLAVGAGIVLFGFNLWIPTNLRKLGFAEPDAMLRNAALMGLPLTPVVAWLYGAWSSKKTLLILTALTAGALLAFALLGDLVLQNRWLLYVLLAIPIWGISSVVSVLSVYSSEIYPTLVRSRAAGFVAGASKAGGVAVISLVVVGIAPPSPATIALVGAVPLLVAAVLLAMFGVETRRRRLEEIETESALAARALTPGYTGR
ncbi:MAG: MFS transporter [Caldimonas sp.]